MGLNYGARPSVPAGCGSEIFGRAQGALLSPPSRSGYMPSLQGTASPYSAGTDPRL